MFKQIVSSSALLASVEASHLNNNSRQSAAQTSVTQSIADLELNIATCTSTLTEGCCTTAGEHEWSDD